jgi:hypothetical protein
MHSNVPSGLHHDTLLVKPRLHPPSGIRHAEQTRLVLAVQFTSSYVLPSTQCAEHARHCHCPGALAYVPAEHAVHEVLPEDDDDLLPAVQLTHAERPSDDAYCPLAHGMHEADALADA